jgi:hypothetical protein
MDGEESAQQSLQLSGTCRSDREEEQSIIFHLNPALSKIDWRTPATFQPIFPTFF